MKQTRIIVLAATARGNKTGAPKSVTVELTVDVEALFRTLGYTAANNKTGRAVLGGGTIVAKTVR